MAYLLRVFAAGLDPGLRLFGVFLRLRSADPHTFCCCIRLPYESFTTRWSLDTYAGICYGDAL